MSDVRELLPLYALGVLAPDEVAAVDRAAAADPALAAELASLSDVAAQLGAATPVAPPPELERRLFASIGGGRYERFATRVGALFEVDVERAREILALAEAPGGFTQPVAGLGVYLTYFRGGARFASDDCGFVRLAPGTAFPLHSHLGAEHTIVLEGTLLDRTTGRRLGPGDEMVHEAGASHHDITAETDEVLFLALAVGGIQIAGTTGRAAFAGRRR